jgi:hypothetical protein
VRLFGDRGYGKKHLRLNCVKYQPIADFQHHIRIDGASTTFSGQPGKVSSVSSGILMIFK